MKLFINNFISLEIITSYFLVYCADQTDALKRTLLPFKYSFFPSSPQFIMNLVLLDN